MKPFLYQKQNRDNRIPITTDEYGIAPDLNEPVPPVTASPPTPYTGGNSLPSPDEIIMGMLFPQSVLSNLPRFRRTPDSTDEPMAAPPPPAPPLDFGGSISSNDQAMIDRLQAFSETYGDGASLPAPTPMPEPPAVTPDPAAAYMREYMTGRRDEVNALLAQYREELMSDDPRRDHWMMRLGEYISALAADGDLANAGAILAEITARDEAMSRELRQRDIELTLRGMGFEDDAAAALAGEMSARHAAETATADRRYNWQAGEIERGDAYARDNANFQARNAESRLRLEMMLAEAQAEAEARGREALLNRATPFLTDPEYADDAARALAEAQGIEDPDMQSTVSANHVESLAARGLYNRIQELGATGEFEDPEALAAYLRQWDPTITGEEVEDMTADEAFRRAMGGANARAAFLANQRELIGRARASSYMSGE